MISVTEVHTLHNRVLGKILTYKKSGGPAQLLALRQAREAKYNYRPYNAEAYKAACDYFGLRAADRTALDNSEWYQYVLEAVNEKNWSLARRFLIRAGIKE